MRVKSVCALILVMGLVCGAMSCTAVALPPGRAYEMVSPPYKGGYGVFEVHAVAADGESIAFDSQGAFSGQPASIAFNQYLSRRNAVSGWSTTPLQVPAELAPFSQMEDVSSTLETVVSLDIPGSNVGVAAHEGKENEFLVHDTDVPDTVNSWEPAGATALKLTTGKPLVSLEQGASANLCHLVIGQTDGALAGVPGDGGTGEQLYDLVAAPTGGCVGDGGPPVRLVGVDNKGKPLNSVCTQLGASGIGRSSDFNSISSDGSEIFFTIKLDPKTACFGGTAQETAQLFVRLGGSKTVEVSRPLSSACEEVPCNGAATRSPALFEGASEDGSRVFFTTIAPLVGEDKDTADDLYMADIGCRTGETECAASGREVIGLTQVSHVRDSGEAADVQGVVRIAPDGARVYFVAHGLLTVGANREGQIPLKGADNLYVYNSITGMTAFVADLCSGPGLSGTAEDVGCPANSNRNDVELWQGPSTEAQSTGDGRFLVFSSYGRLLPGDADDAKDVYRYDAETGMLVRVSVGENGYDANGNENTVSDGAFADAKIVAAYVGEIVLGEKVYNQHEMGSRAVSEDGSRIVFTTSEPLSPEATNGLENAYEWHEGMVSLVSTGSDEETVSDVVMSQSGHNIFFKTVQGLVSQDTDGAADIYDARLGGGFSPGFAPAQPCSGDACQGPLTNPAPLLVPGSVSQVPGGNFVSPSKKVLSKKKRRVLKGKKRRSSKKAQKRGGRRKEGGKKK